MSQKHYVVQGATVKCQFSVEPKLDKLMVKSQKVHFANEKDPSKSLIATDKEIGQTLEKNTFGKCKMQPNGSGDFFPCQAVIDKWSGAYSNVTLSNKANPLLEDSKAGCPIGGPDCISIDKHGQKAEVSKQNFKNVNPDILMQINPMVDMRLLLDMKHTAEGIVFGGEDERKPKTIIAGIYGAGGEDASGNPALKELVKGQGGTMFTSSFGGDDYDIIQYLKGGFDAGKQVKIYGHSRGAAAAVRIANKLGAMNVTIFEMNLYDPVSLYGGGDFVFNYPNVMRVNNYYQRNPIDGVAWSASNPFNGSPVSGDFQWPEINNVNLTGHYYNGKLINHINITRYAINHP